LDLGVENIATDSDGIAYGKISFDRKSSAKRSKVEHALARQKQGSKRWKASKQRLAKIRQHEANARRTAHFQVASQIVKAGHQIIVIEKLQINNMTRSAKGTIDTPGKKRCRKIRPKSVNS
jgi:putative transposase